MLKSSSDEYIDSSHESASILTAEDKKLAELGYKQEFQRQFGWLGTFSFALSISGLLSTITSTLIFGLDAGGAPAVSWCWLIGGVGCMTIVFSVAELVSAYPTSGGLYFTIKYVAAPRYVPIIAWIVGWLNLLGQVCGTASTAYTVSQMTLAAGSMASGFDYVPDQNTTVGVFIAYMVFHTIINLLSTKWLSHITQYYAIVNIGSTIAAIIALLVSAKPLNSGAYIFTNPEPQNGWPNTGFSFLFGFLTVSWVMTDYDATAHICEEIKNPSIKAPVAIIAALSTTYVLGWILNLAFVLAMGTDPRSLIDSPTGLPAAQIFYNALGQTGGVAFLALAIIVGNFVVVTALQAQSRTLYALARDEMMPLSHIWRRINPYTGTPIWSVLINGFICILIGLLGFASNLAVQAIFSVCAIALDWSYCIPFICKIIWPERFTPGPIFSGRFSRFINMYAVLWTCFVSIIFFFPPALPVTPQSMNYAIVVFAAVLFMSLGWWYAGARNYYIGPRINTERLVAQGATGIAEKTVEQDAEIAISK